MKTEIQQVLQMNKAGTITDEQAAELLAELARSGPNSRTAPEFEWSGPDLVKPFVSTVNHTLKHALHATFGGHGTAYKTDMEKNAIHMSRFDAPVGQGFAFSGNTLRMSSVREVRLNHCEMTGNTIDMSKVEELSVKGGKLADSEMRASSVEEMNLADSDVSALSFQGSKVSEFRVSAGSFVDGLRVQGCSLKEFLAEDHVTLKGLMLNGSAMAEIVFRRSEIRDSEIQATSIHELSFEDCRITNALLRGMCVRDTSFSRCSLDDVLFSGIEKWGWKKRGLIDMRFEDCAFTKVLFSNCRLSKTVIKNVTLTNHKFQDLDLSGLTLDGNEAFLAAAGTKH